MHVRDTRRSLLHEILKQVSRSFYLTVAILPSSVRAQISVAYLFARAADTMADTDVLAPSRRLILLEDFRGQFCSAEVDYSLIQAMQSLLIPHHATHGERRLLTHLGDCFRLYQDFSPDDQVRIRTLMCTLTNGMEMDLTIFPGDSGKDLVALPTLAELDRYTYYVAGCVGEFWTEMVHAHVPSLRTWEVERMAKIGARFGKGLQLTNIVKDVARDLQRGRCYLPTSLLAETGLSPADLLRTDAVGSLRPVLGRLISIARDHLDQGWLYTMAIPRREWRLRLACMWPILFAGETLRLTAESPDLLDPAISVKMSRQKVYGIMAMTALTGGCGYVGTAYWGRLRKALA